jgi:hypothetical protein
MYAIYICSARFRENNVKVQRVNRTGSIHYGQKQFKHFKCNPQKPMGNEHNPILFENWFKSFQRCPSELRIVSINSTWSIYFTRAG